MQSFSFDLDFQLPEAEELSNTERAMLRELAVPGGPIAKIMSGLAQHEMLLMRQLAEADLNSQAGILQARDWQTMMKGIAWFRNLFENLLTDQLEEPKDEHSEPDLQPDFFSGASLRDFQSGGPGVG